MAYFPNGSAGMDYFEQHCFNCVNWKENKHGAEGCYVMDLHTLWNYEAVNGKDAPKGSEKRTKWEALEHFIPTTENGLVSGECRMFRPINPEDQVVDKTQALIEWEAIYGKRSE